MTVAPIHGHRHRLAGVSTGPVFSGIQCPAGRALFLVACIASRQRAVGFGRTLVAPVGRGGVLMVIGAGVAHGSLAWAGLANWLPLFWAFWAFRCFLDRSDRRHRAALLLIAGTVPVLLTGLGQMQFGWSGPWQLLGGGIVWFVEAGGKPDGRLSGLFDYANVAGAWLGVIWPFALAALLRAGAPLAIGFWRSSSVQRPWQRS